MATEVGKMGVVNDLENSWFQKLGGKVFNQKVLKGNREIAKWKYRLRGNIFRSFLF